MANYLIGTSTLSTARHDALTDLGFGYDVRML